VDLYDLRLHLIGPVNCHNDFAFETVNKFANVRFYGDDVT